MTITVIGCDHKSGYFVIESQNNPICVQEVNNS